MRAIGFSGAAHDRRIALSSVASGCSVQPGIWEAATAIAPGTIIVANPDAVGGAGALVAVDPNTGAQTLVSQGQISSSRQVWRSRRTVGSWSATPEPSKAAVGG